MDNHNKNTYSIFFNGETLELELIFSLEGTNVMYFTKYKLLFNSDEWETINLIEGDLIPLINQLDEINRNNKMKKYEEFREKLNNIWETYLLEREAIRLETNQEKDFNNGIIIKRTK
ncbi:hypothetical protein MBBAR_4c00440 [Methanobrevibacter arboriphilus JCM 13429 = DSM 1125]|uniref:Uncharacterized protein n=1 Tax=Methanobrevibacter arboriphilus JCM 13429 = DSM 1125 TaxID=1300164 RepID=A0A1V6N3S2_METAZ|nr:hypothetical protein [Methanobrevibacter arboriphilus]OQD59319.1 hypothetical protein MBBAR_4c00440 [Methanobrevibacter arboriphilus JCM 13429 = DSM 1125]